MIRPISPEARTTIRDGMSKLADVHANPTHCPTSDILAQVAPVIALAASAQQQLAEYRAQIIAIEMTDGADALIPKMEQVYQTLARIETDAAGLIKTARDLARAFRQLDRYMPQVQADVERVLLTEEADRGGMETRAADQGEAMGAAFAAGTLPDADRRAVPAIPADSLPT